MAAKNKKQQELFLQHSQAKVHPFKSSDGRRIHSEAVDACYHISSP
jgi:hypothetical protein